MVPVAEQWLSMRNRGRIGTVGKLDYVHLNYGVHGSLQIVLVLCGS